MREYEVEIRVKPRNAGASNEAINYVAMSAKKTVKRSVKGEVLWHVIDDTLVVDIYGVNGIVFRYTKQKISSAIIQGLTGLSLASCIIREYRKYINFLFFM